MSLLCLKFYSLRIKSDLSLTPRSPSQSAISTCVLLQPYLLPGLSRTLLSGPTECLSNAGPSFRPP